MRRVRELLIASAMFIGLFEACGTEQGRDELIPVGQRNDGLQGRANNLRADDTVRGVEPGVSFPLQGVYTPGGSDPMQQIVQGVMIACVNASGIRQGSDAVRLCPNTCLGAGARGGWTGYWRTSTTTGMGVCECSSDQGSSPFANASTLNPGSTIPGAGPGTVAPNANPAPGGPRNLSAGMFGRTISSSGSVGGITSSSSINNGRGSSESNSRGASGKSSAGDGRASASSTVNGKTTTASTD